MSHWTHIQGVISISVFEKLFDEIDGMTITQDGIDEFVRGVVANMPKITGDEGNAQLFINRNQEHDVSRCVHDDNNILGWREYTTLYYVTVIGDLRGRMLDETKGEFNEAMKYLRKTFGKDNVGCIKRIFA